MCPLTETLLPRLARPVPGVSASLLAAFLAAGCWTLSEGYGEPCEENRDCPSVLLQCHDVPRVEARLCLTRAPGPAGEPCVNELECNPGLRCDLATSTCASSGLGLPDCGSDADCGEGERCAEGRCLPR